MEKYEHRRQRLIELIDAKFPGRGGISAMAKRSGIDASYFSRLLYPEGKQGKKRIADTILEKLQDGNNLPPGWFDLPLGAAINDPPGLSTEESLEILSRHGGMPLVTGAVSDDYLPIRRVAIKVSAGLGGGGFEFVDEDADPIYFRENWFVEKGYNHKLMVAVRVVGASMEPTLFEGDIVIINTGDKTASDNHVFAINHDASPAIKRMKRISGQWMLSSDNSDKIRFGDRPCDETTSIIGRVVYRQTEQI